MNAPLATPDGIDRIVTADASSVTPQQFGRVARSLFNPPMPVTEISEKADAARRYIARAWGVMGEDGRELHRAYLAELDEIETRYALVEVERLGPGSIAA